TDTRLDRPVALKIMHAELANDEDFVRRFVAEARSVARLSHPNVVTVYDQGADGRTLYLAMEYVPGSTLRDLLTERSALRPRETLDILEGALAGLAAAHAAGIAHRDVKPENVLLGGHHSGKVAACGRARLLSAATHTKSGMLIGTPAYLAPEQVAGGRTDFRTDVYATGVVLFEMLTGRQPFTGDTPLTVAYRHVNEVVPAPSTLVPGLPPAGAAGRGGGPGGRAGRRRRVAAPPPRPPPRPAARPPAAGTARAPRPRAGRAAGRRTRHLDRGHRPAARGGRTALARAAGRPSARRTGWRVARQAVGLAARRVAGAAPLPPAGSPPQRQRTGRRPRHGPGPRSPVLRHPGHRHGGDARAVPPERQPDADRLPGRRPVPESGTGRGVLAAAAVVQPQARLPGRGPRRAGGFRPAWLVAVRGPVHDRAE